MHYLLIIVFTLISSVAFSKNSKSLATLMAHKKLTSVDVDGDKKPDFFKTLKNGEITKIVYQPTRNPGFKTITKIKPNDRGYLKTTFFKKTSPVSQEEYTRHKKYSQLTSIKYQKEKIVTKFYKKKYIRKKFQWKKNKWKFISTERKPIEIATSDTATSQPKAASRSSTNSSPKPPPAQVFAFKPGAGCTPFDKRQIEEATGYLFDVMLKCVEKYNKDLVIAFSEAMLTHQNEVQCYKKLCDIYPCNKQDKIDKQWGFTMIEEPEGPIYLDLASPGQLFAQKPKFSPQQRVRFLAQTLFHEMLHKVLRTNHSETEEFKDPIFSCPFLCDTTESFSNHIDPTEACYYCIAARIPDLKQPQYRGDPHSCRKPIDVFKNINEAYPVTKMIDQAQACSQAKGESRNFQCWCEKYQSHFDPTNHVCE